MSEIPNPTDAGIQPEHLQERLNARFDAAGVKGTVHVQRLFDTAGVDVIWRSPKIASHGFDRFVLSVRFDEDTMSRRRSIRDAQDKFYEAVLNVQYRLAEPPRR